mmetsp:Transcript_11213/g.37130  ORF Transcript_11213/g.37130 Transcript_11213/m.37130 type:complete len:226 (+) Transcript_11213:207-884(+)
MHTMHKRTLPHLPLRRSCTRGSTSARSAVLLLQQIREQLGVTQLRDVAHSLQTLQLAPVPVGADHHQRRARRGSRQRLHRGAARLLDDDFELVGVRRGGLGDVEGAAAQAGRGGGARARLGGVPRDFDSLARDSALAEQVRVHRHELVGGAARVDPLGRHDVAHGDGDEQLDGARHARARLHHHHSAPREGGGVLDDAAAERRDRGEKAVQPLALGEAGEGDARL